MESVADFGSFEGTPLQLRQLVLDQILTYPETHHQSDWGDRCGTTACVAGWAMLLHDGAVPLLTSIDRRAPERRARELLDLSEYDTYRLFYACNNKQAVQALKYLVNDEPIDWDLVGHKFSSDTALKEHLVWWASTAT